MSKLYKKYLSLKIEEPNTFYLFESGIFYIFIAEDARFMSQELNLKLTNLNSNIVKCGFPTSQLNKYLLFLSRLNHPIKIVSSNSFISYEPKNYFSNKNSREFLRKCASINIDSLSISNAFKLLEELASESTDIINEIEGNDNEKEKNLYKDICKIENIISAYDEVCKNTKNKNKVDKYKEYRCIYIARIYTILINKSYVPGPYNHFTIYEPKERNVASQGMQDKTINHLVARHILYPAILPCLLDVNVASRKNLGTSKGLYFFKRFDTKCKIKYKDYYILKCDIRKFFASIDQNILKEKLKKKIKDKDALKIVFDIIDSEKNGLNIGSMTSQVLAIFYLNDMDHFIKEQLKIKYYVRYQDDFLLFHKSKQYLKYCLKEIENFLSAEHLHLNNKTRLFKNTNNFIFLGRDKNGKYARYRTVRRKLKKRKYLYTNNNISLNSLACSIISYENLCSKKGSLLTP